MNSENWKAITGYEGQYEVSDLGRIRALHRLDSKGRPVAGRILKQSPAGRYASVHLSRDGKAKTLAVHLIVAHEFMGPTPAGHVVAHEDGNAMNPELMNLRFKTPVENEADKLRHGTKFVARGELNGHARLTTEQAAEIARAARAGTESQRAIAERYGIDQSLVSHIKHGRHWYSATEGV